jgi:hypothetical protein
MKVLLAGGLGRIGKRYMAILKYMDQPFDITDPAYDDSQPKLADYDSVIIATPTHTHYQWCLKCAEAQVPFLCEKPLSKSLNECADLSYLTKVGFVVCNYKYVVKPFFGWRANIHIEYDYYNPGDDLEWACCQLIYLDPKAELKSESPILKLRVNNRRIDYYKIEESYISMLTDFITGDYENLWTLEDGYNMTKNCWIEYEDSFGIQAHAILSFNRSWQTLKPVQCVEMPGSF